MTKRLNSRFVDPGAELHRLERARLSGHPVDRLELGSGGEGEAREIAGAVEAVRGQGLNLRLRYRLSLVHAALLALPYRSEGPILQKTCERAADRPQLTAIAGRTVSPTLVNILRSPGMIRPRQ